MDMSSLMLASRGLGWASGYSYYPPARAFRIANPIPTNKQAIMKYVPACISHSIGSTPFLKHSSRYLPASDLPYHQNYCIFPPQNNRPGNIRIKTAVQIDAQCYNQDKGMGLAGLEPAWQVNASSFQSYRVCRLHHSPVSKEGDENARYVASPSSAFDTNNFHILFGRRQV